MWAYNTKWKHLSSPVATWPTPMWTVGSRKKKTKKDRTLSPNVEWRQEGLSISWHPLGPQSTLQWCWTTNRYEKKNTEKMSLVCRPVLEVFGTYPWRKRNGRNSSCCGLPLLWLQSLPLNPTCLPRCPREPIIPCSTWNPFFPSFILSEGKRICYLFTFATGDGAISGQVDTQLNKRRKESATLIKEKWQGSRYVCPTAQQLPLCSSSSLLRLFPAQSRCFLEWNDATRPLSRYYRL